MDSDTTIKQLSFEISESQNPPLESQPRSIGGRKASHSGGFKVTLIGHSMGGYITLAFTEKYPEYLNAFGLFHSTAYADTIEKKNTRMKGIEFINRNGSFGIFENDCIQPFFYGIKK